jgi:hypothetical protein
MLLVDKEQKDLKYFATLLERIGYSLRTYMNYREAELRLRSSNASSQRIASHRSVKSSPAKCDVRDPSLGLTGPSGLF